MIEEIKTTQFIDKDTEQEYHFKPVDDTITIEPIKGGGYKMKYLVQDDNPLNPTEMGDDSLMFLVHDHRDFQVESDIVVKDILRNIYLGKTDGETKKVLKDFFFFPVSALIHSGVWLSLANSFSADSGGWDTSHVGGIFVSKKEFKTKEQATKAAQSLIEEWNQYLTGEVYGCVVETLDKDKNYVSNEAVWGYYGEENAKECLKNDF